MISDVPSGTFTSISSGWKHACAIDTSGSIQRWGSNGSGDVITKIPSGTFTAISSGRQYSFGTLTTGNVVCWGIDTYGLLKVP